MARGLGRIGAGVVAVWIATVLFACADLRQDELDCEEAVAVLKDCCPDFPVTMVSCVYESSACSTVYPDFPVSESQCIRSQSCSSLVSTGVCARAQAQAEAHGGASTTEADTASAAGVCP